jgi:hypothetical protein
VPHPLSSAPRDSPSAAVLPPESLQGLGFFRRLPGNGDGSAERSAHESSYTVVP